jgi:hypothetical protein
MLKQIKGGYSPMHRIFLIDHALQPGAVIEIGTKTRLVPFSQASSQLIPFFSIPKANNLRPGYFHLVYSCIVPFYACSVQYGNPDR